MTKKVFVWGKFEELHSGHIEFLKNAKKFGDELYVLLVPDVVIVKIKNHALKPQEERKKALLKLGFIKDVYIDSLHTGLKEILKAKPDVFVFGHDQVSEWTEKIKEHLHNHKIFPEYKRLGVYNNGLHASQLRQRK